MFFHWERGRHYSGNWCFYFSPTFYWNLVCTGQHKTRLTALGLVQYLLYAQFTHINIFKQVRITFYTFGSDRLSDKLVTPLMLIHLIRANYWWHGPSTHFLWVVLLIPIWQLRQGEKAEGFPAESGSTWELLFFYCLIIFTLHRFFFMRYLGRGGGFFLLQSDDEAVQVSRVWIRSSRPSTDVFTPCSLNPCPSLTFLPPAWPAPIPHMLSSAWDSSGFMRSRITFSVNEIKMWAMHSASGWVNMAHRSDWWIVFIHEQFLQNFLLTPNHYQMWVAGGCWNSNTCCITLNGIHFGKHRKFHFSK